MPWTWAFTDAEQHPPTRCVVLAGAGPSFCAGADLQHFLSQHAQVGSPIAFLRQVSALITRFEASPLPIVAALHGHAVAGGLELALACDVAVAAESTLIGDGHIRNNLLPAGGSSVRLPRKVGDAMARWLALTGQLVPARRLADAGWLHAVVPDDQLSSTVATVAMSLAESSGPAQSAFKSPPFRPDHNGRRTRARQGTGRLRRPLERQRRARGTHRLPPTPIDDHHRNHTTIHNSTVNRYEDHVVLATGGARARRRNGASFRGRRRGRRHRQHQPRVGQHAQPLVIQQRKWARVSMNSSVPPPQGLGGRPRIRFVDVFGHRVRVAIWSGPRAQHHC